MLSNTQIHEFKALLRRRYKSLREEIRQELLDSDDEHFIDLAGQVHDLEEESVADLLVDVDLAVVDLHVEEIRAIEAALMRMARNEYGTCSECGDDISLDRLLANPMAIRCVTCQERFERTHAGSGKRSL